MKDSSYDVGGLCPLRDRGKDRQVDDNQHDAELSE